MSNPALPYMEATSESEESSDEEHSTLLSNNLGVLNNDFHIKNVKLMDQTDASEYDRIRNLYFTPEITKRHITVDKTDASTDKKISLSENFKLPTKNIIGFKILKASFKSNNSGLYYADLIIPELPEIACIQREDGISILERVHF